MDKIDFVCLVIIASGLFILGWVGNGIYDKELVGFGGVGNESNLLSYSHRVNQEVNKFWKYNLSNINTDLTLEQLKEQGGVCWHYAKYYVDRVHNDTNFYAKTVRISVNKTVSHEFAIASNEEGYCILDQSYLWCFPFAKLGGDE